MKIIIPGEPEEKESNSLLTVSLFRIEAEKVLKNMEWWETHRRVNELRRSCGVPSKETTISVRLPPRYQSNE